eukprot:6315047-Prymnesium_polylepis.1
MPTQPVRRPGLKVPPGASPPYGCQPYSKAMAGVGVNLMYALPVLYSTVCVANTAYGFTCT